MASARTPELAAAAAATAAVAIAALVGACVPDAPERYVQHPPALAALRLRLPEGALAGYDVVLDQWVVARAGSLALVDSAPRAGVAGPDAYAQTVGTERRSKLAVVARESLPDGFAVTLTEHAASEQRVTVVVRELGNQWLRCVGDVLLCKSLKRR